MRGGRPHETNDYTSSPTTHNHLAPDADVLRHEETHSESPVAPPRRHANRSPKPSAPGGVGPNEVPEVSLVTSTEEGQAVALDGNTSQARPPPPRPLPPSRPSLPKANSPSPSVKKSHPPRSPEPQQHSTRQGTNGGRPVPPRPSRPPPPKK